MVHQSDLPFRLQTVQHGATSTWTQMYLATSLNSELDLLETLARSLETGRNSTHNSLADTRGAQGHAYAPQVVQLAGNDVGELVSAARKVAPWADAIDLNLGCPQRHAELGGYGAYLLPKQHWSRVTTIVSAMVQAVDLPITTKIRITVPKEQTADLAVQLSLAGSSLITVHPRFASSVRRRKGLADLDMVRQVSNALNEHGLLRHSRSPHGDTAIVSNGNVRYHSDLSANMHLTDASGIMVGEALLENPALFGASVDATHFTPDELARQYLDIRQQYNCLDAPLPTAKQHLIHLLAPQHRVSASQDTQHLATSHRKKSAMSAKISAVQTEADLLTFKDTLLNRATSNDVVM